jgi:FtsZ-binding cell division protein ZapB
MAVVHIFVGLLVSFTIGDAVFQQDAVVAAANPIRKVVTMLQAMQTKVLAEGAKEKELYDKFSCYCQNGAGELSKSISDAETKVPLLGSDIAEAEAKKKQLTEELKKHQADRAAATSAIATATTLRNNAAAAFTKDKAQSTSNIDALSQGITAISKGMGGSFLQTNAAQVLKQLALNQATLLDADRQDIMAFLSGGEEGQYVPQSGEIVGVLKKLLNDMNQDLAEAEASEAKSIASHDQLMFAKTKELNAHSKAIESKSVRVGQLAVEISQMQNDHEDTEKGLTEDKKFLRDLDGNCAAQAKEWDERSKTRSEEVLAIADSIKLLNDDDALELFKKTLPTTSSSFVQMSANENIMRERSLSILRAASKKSTHRPQFDFISLAIQGKKVGLAGVIKMVDGMITTLKQEQKDEDGKKEYCSKQLDFANEKKKSLAKTVSDLDISIQDATDGIATLKEEIKSLTDKIQDLDQSVTEATEQRKSGHQEFTEFMSSDSAAKELLGFAINRLNKFYNPKLAPPAFIAATGVTAFVEVSAHVHQQDAPPPPPATFDAYAGQKEESGGVMKMMDLLVKDLEKSMQEAQHEEKESQKDYEQMLQDSAEKRALDQQSLTDKNIAKASMEADVESSKEAKSSAGTELMATEKYISSLHGECDFLLQYFDVRKEARTGEVDALVNAKSVLSGADLSLLQQQRSRNLRKRPASAEA